MKLRRVRVWKHERFTIVPRKRYDNGVNGNEIKFISCMIAKEMIEDKIKKLHVPTTISTIKDNLTNLQFKNDIG